METIILATNNENKVKEISAKLKEFNIEVISQREVGCDIDVEETGTTFEENATLKAEAIYKELGRPVIADDSGLEIDALNGEPGVYSKRFAGQNASDEDRINKVLNLLQNVEESKRTARFKCTLCYIDENGTKHVFEGVCEGKIADKPCGNNKFGYDPIFIYEDKTFAQMTDEEKNAVSHRGRAVQQLVDFFENK